MTSHLNPRLHHVGPATPRRPRTARPTPGPYCHCADAWAHHDPLSGACTRCGTCGRYEAAAGTDINHDTEETR